MKNKTKKKGVTLVELLAVIVILGILSGIGIVSVTRMINKSKEENLEASNRTLRMAAITYSQEQKEFLPKSIGESKKITAKTLRENKYLTEDITNNNEESCMKYSYVKIYKRNTTEYTYTSYLYCGNETPSSEPSMNKPTATIEFSNPKDVAIAGFKLDMYGDNNLTNSKHDPKLEIDGYSMTISAAYNNDTETKEVYSSGSISGRNKKHITLDKKFSEYIDLSGITKFKINVTIINSAGETFTFDKSITSNGQTFEDDEKPKCVYPENGNAIGEKSENEWINKETSESDKVRRITVGCDDGDGSGCKDERVTKTWENKSVEYDYIEIYDNYDKTFGTNKETGNRGIDTRGAHSGQQDCRVRVNMDLHSPSATLNAYTVINDKEVNVLKDKKISDNKTTLEIKSSEYSNLTGSKSDKWMNQENYKDGVKFVINVKDDLHLYYWKWETNKENQTKVNKNEISVSNTDGAIGQFEQLNMDENDSGVKEETIEVTLKGEGKRYGVLTIYDRAGNTVKYEIYANIDRTAPEIPSYSATNIAKKSTYYVNTWSNDSIGVKVTINDSTENDSMSGREKYQYKINNNKYTDGSSFEVKDQGIFKIIVRSCDYAGNCSAATKEANVMHDSVAPTCTVTAITSDNKTYDGEWLGKGKSVTVSAKCSDETSKCVENAEYNSFSKKYDFEINTKTAGARSDMTSGKVRDQAGNETTCATKEVKIDYTNPTCEVTGGNSSWTKESITIKATCKDNNGNVNSGCKTNTLQKTYDSLTNTTEAGAVGIRNGGRFYDQANNYVDCPADQEAHVDNEGPTITSCTVTNGKISSYTGTDNGGSGVKTYQFSYSTSDTSPGKFSATNSPKNNCGNTYYGYVRAVDNLGNVGPSKKCSGSYETKSCCSESNPYGCDWITSCREGNTFVYTSSSLSQYAGTVEHHLGGHSNKLYILDSGSNWYKVYTDGFKQNYGSGNVVYIYKNCVGPSNKVCPYNNCKG